MLWLWTTMLACGGSGVGGDKLLVDLDTDDREKLCEWAASEAEGAVGTCTIDGKEYEIERNTVSECADFIGALDGSCDVSVAEYEDCQLAFFDDVCAALQSTPPECVAVDGCVGEG